MLTFRYETDFLVDVYTQGPFVLESRWPTEIVATLGIAFFTVLTGYLTLRSQACCVWPIVGFLAVVCFFTAASAISMTYRAYPTRPFSAEDIRDLASVRRLRCLVFHKEEVTEEHARAIASLDQLQEVDLWKAHITNASIQHLAKLPRLERLIVDHTSITDDCIPYLLAMPSLRCLYIVDTGISDEDILELMSLKPQLNIELNDSAFLDIDEAMS